MTTHILIRSLDRGATLFLIVVAAIAVGVPILNLALPESSGNTPAMRCWPCRST